MNRNVKISNNQQKNQVEMIHSEISPMKLTIDQMNEEQKEQKNIMRNTATKQNGN